MKSIRKSLNGNKDPSRSTISTPVLLPAVSKPASAIQPPQKVIKALEAYRSTAPQELSFKKGDFFYVLKDASVQGTYFEAHNPVSGARGLVPRHLFEEFSKTTVPLRSSQPPLGRPPAPVASPPPQVMSPKAPKSQVFYAIVLHDFEAERADELDAKRGDAITVVAQSNREWFVAKPIGRLGRPGLIPVSFVEIHDPTTGKPIPDVEGLMDRGDLPKVEDWKRAMFNYKQNSIALGVIDTPSSRDSVPNSPFMPQSQPPMPPPDPNLRTQPPVQQQPPPEPQFTMLPEGMLVEALCNSFHFEMDEYWFRIDAVFQPYPPPGQKKLPPARQLILFRVYNDFYDFQVSLLDTFPREAGRQPPHPRTLPYMPGPAQNVDDTLTATRRTELDEYLHNLCDLARAGAAYILEHRVVRDFFSLKPGDVENLTEPRVREIDALFGERPLAPESGNGARDMVQGMERMRVQDGDRSEGSDYEDEGYGQQQRYNDQDRHPYARAENRQPSNEYNLRLHAHAQNHQRSGSSSSINRTQSPYAPNSRSNSPDAGRINLSNHPYSSQSRWDSTPTTAGSHNQSSPSISSLNSTQPTSFSGRSRSQSNATMNNFNSPPISTTNPQTAFIKIKVYDRVSDDLIAIRVHPRVTLLDLIDKIQTRLGGEVAKINYRDSLSNELIPLASDSDLRNWVDNTDKLVLFAD